MLLAGIASVLFGMLVLVGALANFIQAPLVGPLVLQMAVGATLLTVGWRAWREPGAASFAAAVVVFLSAIFFAYRFLVSGGMVAGLLLLTGFAALFVVLLGAFLAVQQQQQQHSDPDESR